MNYHIGIDDTDSASKGMCTTYLGAKVLRFLLGKKAMLLDYPLLVRLNPNIPFRTRGNGAVCLRFEATPKVFAEVKDFALGLVARDSVLDDEKTNPGVVFLQGSVPRELKAFYSRAL
ncbi:MAG TPA: tRNA(Ile2) 2-agmatinylcytidine synthetase, partial [archaeon]|nr:tRNA(Ile2) 2-agmatinylcytidine synthetase [archaeon]